MGPACYGRRVKVALIIPAAGSGERLGRGVPKALVDLGGLPMLRRTVERLGRAASFLETVILAPPSAVPQMAAALAGAPAELGKVRVLGGGATRQESVSIGVASLTTDANLVCVHDAARPLVSPATVRGVLEAASANGAATAASRPVDSVRQDQAGGVSIALDRASLWLVETPQAFGRELLERAHRQALAAGRTYTDDASLVESIGVPIQMVASQGRNLKVTLEADLALAAVLLAEGGLEQAGRATAER